MQVHELLRGEFSCSGGFEAEQRKKLIIVYSAKLET